MPIEVTLVEEPKPLSKEEFISMWGNLGSETNAEVPEANLMALIQTLESKRFKNMATREIGNIKFCYLYAMAKKGSNSIPVFLEVGVGNGKTKVSVKSPVPEICPFVVKLMREITK
jgi:hypothetical protein